MFFVRRSSTQLFRFGLQSNRASRYLFSAVANNSNHDEGNVKLSVDFLKDIVQQTADNGHKILLPLADSKAMDKILQPLTALTEDGNF